MKILILLCALTLSACGGGSGSFTPTPAAPTPTEKFGHVTYVGDDLVALGCDANYAAPWFPLQLDTPNASCSAVQGETSAQTAERFLLVLDQHPSVVVILTGLNDIRNGFTGAPSAEAVVEMVQAAQERGVIVVLVTLPTSVDFDQQIQVWNAQIKRIAQTYGTQIGDYYAGMADPSSVPEVGDSLQDMALMDVDGVYPSAAGFALLWDVVCESLDQDHVD